MLSPSLSAPAPTPPPSILRGSPGPILVATVLASSMGFIDASVTALAMPAIRASLHAAQAEVEWVGAAYLLILSAVILCGGALGDRFGTVRLFRGGIWGFMACSAACALAPDATSLIAARAAQGLAAAAMVPGSMAVIARAYPRETRGRALGLWASAATATTMAGPVLGGAILSIIGDHGWRLIFALNLPFGLAALSLLHRHAIADKGRPGTPVDVLGAGLAVLALGLIALALSFGGWLVGLGGAAALAAFLWTEARSPAPMIRLRIFANPAFAAANGFTLLLYFGVMGLNFYLPTAAITAWGLAPWQMTSAILPVSAMIAVLSPVAGRLADRQGPGRMMAAGAATVTLAQIGMALLAGHGSFATHVFPMMMLSGFGMSMVVAPLTAAVMAHADEASQGAASGINNAMARIATLMAVALMGRVARIAYPGFGSDMADPAATATAFGTLALLAATCSALAAAAAWKWVTAPK